MKSSLLTPLFAAVLAVTGFALLPVSAHAGGSSRCFSHKCGGCGGSIYKKRVVVRRDRCGRPVHRWVRISHRCAPVRPPSCSHGHGHGHGYSASRKIHPTEIIFPILNFIASQKASQSYASSGPPPSPAPPVSRDAYGYTPRGSGKDVRNRPSYDAGKPYGAPSDTREFRY